MTNNLQRGAFLQGGKYKILQTLGQGGFGVTYEAEQVALHRRVAIKEFFMKEYCDRDSTTSHVTLGASEGSKELVERFRTKFVREAQMIAGFDNPHIIKIYDIFEENGTAYYVMAFLDGGSLSEKVKSNGPLPEVNAIDYIKQVGSALEYIHKQNILHLDVKPSNILLNPAGEAVLIDFGISKHYDTEGSQTSTTPAGISKGFAPMEQYQQGNISKFSPATDIYSLGATLYFLLTGETPPEAAEVYEDGLPEIKGNASGAAKEAVKCAMAPKRKDRPQNISAFLSMLPSSPKQEIKPEENKKEEETRIVVTEETTILQDAPKVSQPQTPKPVSNPWANTQSQQSRTPVKQKGHSNVPVILLVTFAVCVGLYFLLRNPYHTEAERAYRREAEKGDMIAQYNLGLCYEEGNGVDQDYAEAAQWFAKAAKQGSADAQVHLGVLLATGQGVKKDMSAAHDMFRRSAEQGNINAHHYLGWQYYAGDGVKMDWSNAVKWLQPAAEGGLNMSQFILGYIYYTGGNGVAQDYNLAFKWFKACAEQGDENAQFYTGVCYYYGYGTKRDYKSSAEWWRKAADQGDSMSQFNLGVCYENGNGVKRDIGEAKKWYRKALDSGCEEASDALKNLESQQKVTTTTSANKGYESDSSAPNRSTSETQNSAPMSISQSSATIYVGDNLSLSATNFGTSLVWESSDPSIASVSKYGVVTGHKQGYAYIYAKGIEERHCLITVLNKTTNTSSSSSASSSSNTFNTSQNSSSKTIRLKIGETLTAPTLSDGKVGKWESFGKEAETIYRISGTSITGLKEGTAFVWAYIASSPYRYSVIVGNGGGSSTSSSTSSSSNEYRTIAGNVKTTGGLTVIGAAIMVKGTTRGTTTDSNGQYRISAKTGEVLTVTYRGYSCPDQTVGNGSNIINFTMTKK